MERTLGSYARPWLLLAGLLPETQGSVADSHLHTAVRGGKETLGKAPHSLPVFGYPDIGERTEITACTLDVVEEQLGS